MTPFSEMDAWGEAQRSYSSGAHGRGDGSGLSLVGFVSVMCVPAALGVLAAGNAIPAGGALIGFAGWVMVAVVLTEFARRRSRPRIRLENLEQLEPLEVYAGAQAELEGLANMMRAEGFRVYVAKPGEPFHAHLQESAEQLTVDVLNVVHEHGVEPAARAALDEIIRRWARRRRYFRDRDDARAIAYIWGPDNEILATVKLPKPEDPDAPS